MNIFERGCSIKQNKIVTDLYRKETDRNQYLLTSSCHPVECTDNIPFSLALRIVRICSEIETREKRFLELKELHKGSVDHFADFWIQKSHHFYDFWIQKKSHPFLRFLDPEIAPFLRFLDPEIRLVHFCNFWIQKLQYFNNLWIQK